MKEKIKQLELFTEGGTEALYRQEPRPRKVFFYWLFSQEKFIFTLITVIIISVISFCLGVEKGKRVFSPKIQKDTSVVTLAIAKQSLISTKELNKEAIIKKESSTPVKQVKKEAASKSANKGYVIQVASCKKKASAQQAVKVLKSKGYSNAFIMTKGDYVIICIGGFNDKESALPSLNKLKKSYSDCLLRKI